jgi:predicted transposase/invertase (TIGR01784 family)
MKDDANIVIPDLLPPSDDGVFKALLTHPEAGSVLRDVISSALALPVAEATIVSNELPISNMDEKRERFDVACKLDDGSQVDVEMQADPMKGDSLATNHANIKARAIYNLCDLHSSQKGRGVLYYDLARSFQIMFCDYTVFPEVGGFVRRFSFRDECGDELLDSVGIVFVELTKLGSAVEKPIESMSSLEMWGLFFAHASESRYRELIARMTIAKEEIKMATELLSNISKDEIERAHYRSRRMYQMDMEHNFAASRAEGLAEGEAKGRAEGEAKGRTEGEAKGRAEGEKLGRMENARRMKADGMDSALIAKYTELTIEEIDELV